VKVLENQWFIVWGRRVEVARSQVVDEMRIVPEDLRAEFSNVVDWLRKACSTAGLGTRSMDGLGD
jgi:leucyl-tRNA synthetase